MTRGYSVMLGYWGDEARTAQAIDRTGGMHAGDLGVMDADGFVDIPERLKDMIIRGGENICPREVEAFLYTHPAVSNVQVYGVPDAKYGKEVGAWIQLRQGAEGTAEDIRDFCRDQIARYKVPRHVRFVDAYSMRVTGKVLKCEMRNRMAAETKA